MTFEDGGGGGSRGKGRRRRMGRRGRKAELQAGLLI